MGILKGDPKMGTPKWGPQNGDPQKGEHNIGTPKWGPQKGELKMGILKGDPKMRILNGDPILRPQIETPKRGTENGDPKWGPHIETPKWGDPILRSQNGVVLPAQQIQQLLKIGGGTPKVEGCKEGGTP